MIFILAFLLLQKRINGNVVIKHLNESAGKKCAGEGRISATEYTEWQRPLSGVHSIMMEKLKPGWWGWRVHAHSFPLYLPSRKKLKCTLQVLGQIHSPYFSSTPRCTLWSTKPFATCSWVRNLSTATGQGIDSRNWVWNWVAKLLRLAGRYDNHMPTRFLTPIAGLKLRTLQG